MFRFPGGKSKLSDQIIKRLIITDEIEYREPFVGGFSIGSKFLANNNINAWINDKDLGIACIWQSIKSDEFRKRIEEFKPSVDAFFQFKKELLSLSEAKDVVDIAFKKLAIHQMSYSGLGTKAGTPIGGKKQLSKWDVGCRWSPKKILREIELCKKLNYRCTNLDFSELILDDNCKSLIYLDPPYYVKGNVLYQYGFTQQDHERLAELLKKTKHTWLLSYDDCEEIRKLYSWAKMEVVKVKYSITAKKVDGAKKSTEKPELLIWK